MAFAVAVEPLVFDALLHFVAREGELITHDDLHEHLWPEVHVTQSSVYRVVMKIRRILGSERHRLQTVQRRGYRFQAGDDPEPAKLRP